MDGVFLIHCLVRKLSNLEEIAHIKGLSKLFAVRVSLRALAKNKKLTCDGENLNVWRRGVECFCKIRHILVLGLGIRASHQVLLL